MPAVSLLLGLVAALTLLAGGTAPRLAPAAAQAAVTENAAGLVIQTAPGEVKTVCVRFTEEHLTGEELLRRADEVADVEPQFARFGSMGVAVCSLCGVGCSSDNCFCDPAAYWNYSTATETGWQGSSRGASHRTLGHGDMDGWAWGPQGSQPPVVAFEVVCSEAAGASPEPSPSPAPPPSPSPEPTPSPAPLPKPSPEPSPSPAPLPKPSPEPSPSPESPDPAPTAPASPSQADAPNPEPAPSPEPDPSPTPAPTGERQDDFGPSPVPGAPSPGSPDGEAAVAARNGDGGGSGGLLAFAAVLAAVLATTWWRRRTRTEAGPG